MCFTCPLCHGVELLNTAPPPLLRWPPRPKGVSLGTYTIRNGRGFGLTQAIREVHIGSFDVMLLTETKITSEAYYHNQRGYDVVCPSAVATDTCGAQGGVELLVRELPQVWSVELTRFHGPNVVRCRVVSGSKC